MSKSTATVITVTAALLAIAAPVVLAILLADRQAREAEMGRAMVFARDVLLRSEKTSAQSFAAINALVAAHAADPCSEDNVELMRRYDLSSSYLQAVGYVLGNRMICSSQGRDSKGGLELGPVDYVSPIGARMRLNVRFPFDPDTSYVVAEMHGYAVIVNKNLPLDAATEKDASLAAYVPASSRVIASHGYVDPRWLRLSKDQYEATFISKGYVVAVTKSRRFFVGTVVALPVSYVVRQTRRTAEVLLPAGIFAGIILALAVVYLGRQQMSMPAALRAALKRHELFLLYQPIVDLRSRQFVGAEALIRWRRPSGELVPPDFFIPIAEQEGLIQRITERVIELVERDVEDLFQRHPQFYIAINLSALDLEADCTVELLQRLATNTGAARGNLVVEVSERGLIKREPAKKIVHELRARHIRVAIDDFGTGYSSLAYLESFELDFLKIDKLFVDTMNRDAPTSQVVLHIIEMAKSLRLQIVAEGVETDAQAHFLRERGVPFAQGWLFGRPMPMNELRQRIRQAPVMRMVV